MDIFKNSEIDNKESSSSNKTFSDTFIDKLNDDFVEGQKVGEVTDKLVESITDIPKNDLSDKTIFVDKLSDTLSIDFIIGLFNRDFLDNIHNSYGFNLSDDEIAESIQKASDFFHLSSPKDIREDWTTGVILGMSHKEYDDILCYNREQMKEIGISDREGFDLVMTHEGAHRALQKMEGRFSSHQEELCCDFLAGVRAGLNGMDEEKLVKSLEDTTECASHPSGLLRAEAIRSGAQYAKEYLAINNEAPTFSKCIERFEKKLDEMYGNVAEIQHDINLKEDISNNAEIKALFVDDRAYHLKEAQTAKEWAQWHHKRANEAIAKGDLTLAKDHISKAEFYECKANEHIQTSNKCTK